MLQRSGPAWLAMLALSACVAPREATPPPPPAPRPAPAPAPLPAPPPATDWRDRALSPGDWSYERSGTANYGLPGAPRLTLGCDRQAGQVRIGLPDAAVGPVTIHTTYGDVARPGQASQGGLQLMLPARDPLLDQMAFSRGRFMLAAGGQELILPAWPELARVVEDCR